MGKKGDALRAAKAAKRASSAVAQFGPIRLNGIEKEKILDITGLSMAQLDAWVNEQREDIDKRTEKKYQALLYQAENVIAVLYVVSILKSLEGYHWGRSASNHIIEHFPELSKHMQMEELKPAYEYLHEKWGIEFEFDEAESNRLIHPAADSPDWRDDYFKDMGIPDAVVSHVLTKYWRDAYNVAIYEMQLGMLWELCEDFGFHKKPGMMERFMKGMKTKFEYVDIDECHPEEIKRMLKNKYGMEVNISNNEVKDSLGRYLWWEGEEDESHEGGGAVGTA